MSGKRTPASFDVHPDRAYSFAVAKIKSVTTKPPKKLVPEGPDQRILSLLMLLLEANQPVGREEIFQRIAAYRTKIPSAGERKFERDKKDLRALGVAIEEDEEDRNLYFVRQREYGLRPVQFDDDERVALILAAEAMRGTEGLIYGELVDDALRKLSFDGGRAHRAFTPANLGITMPARYQSAKDRRVMSTLGSAIEGQKSVTITYCGLSGQSTVRLVDPYAVVYGGGTWQLVGHCHLREKPRTFRLDRISKIKVAPKPGTPDFERPANWNLSTYVQRSPWFFEAGETQSTFEVVLDIGPERAWFADENFGPESTREILPENEFRGEGWVRIRFRSGNARYIITRVLDAVGHLRVVEPAELRARVRAVAATIATANQTEGKSP
jgi:predicted DNA-binding transcriptional regulator YafY